MVPNSVDGLSFSVACTHVDAGAVTFETMCILECKTFTQTSSFIRAGFRELLFYGTTFFIFSGVGKPSTNTGANNLQMPLNHAIAVIMTPQQPGLSQPAEGYQPNLVAFDSFQAGKLKVCRGADFEELVDYFETLTVHALYVRHPTKYKAKHQGRADKNQRLVG